MRALFFTLFIAITSFSASAQEATVTSCKIQEHGEGLSTITMTLEMDKQVPIDFVNVQLTGERIPKYTTIVTLHDTGSKATVNGKHEVAFSVDFKLNTTRKGASNDIKYVVKKTGPTNFRNIKPGQMIYFPPVEK